MKKKGFLTVSILAIFIIIIIYSLFINKETTTNLNTPKASQEHYELETTVTHTSYDEAPDKIGYVEEKDGKLYEGTLEKKSFTQLEPGKATIEYVGNVYETDEQDTESGIIWIEMSIDQEIEDINNPPLQKDVVVKFYGRLYKGTLDLELGEEIDIDNKIGLYSGRLYYDDTLTDSDRTDL